MVDIPRKNTPVMKTEELLKKVSDLLKEYEGEDFQITTVGCKIIFCEQEKTYVFDGEKFVELSITSTS